MESKLYVLRFVIKVFTSITTKAIVKLVPTIDF